MCFLDIRDSERDKRNHRSAEIRTTRTLTQTHSTALHRISCINTRRPYEQAYSDIMTTLTNHTSSGHPCFSNSRFKHARMVGLLLTCSAGLTCATDRCARFSGFLFVREGDAGPKTPVSGHLRHRYPSACLFSVNKSVRDCMYSKVTYRTAAPLLILVSPPSRA